MKSVVRAYIFNSEGLILMARHKKDTPWVLPGGHIESGETLHDAIIREINEEFGLSVRFFEMDYEEILHHKGKKLKHHPLPISIYDLSYIDSEGRDKSRREYVFLMETDDTVKKTQLEEIYEYRWFDPGDILTMKPNIDTWDFIIEMLEKVLGTEEDDE